MSSPTQKALERAIRPADRRKHRSLPLSPLTCVSSLGVGELMELHLAGAMAPEAEVIPQTLSPPEHTITNGREIAEPGGLALRPAPPWLIAIEMWHRSDLHAAPLLVDAAVVAFACRITGASPAQAALAAVAF